MWVFRGGMKRSGSTLEWRVEAIGSDLRFDPHSLLHHNHINTGARRAWTRVLTPAESALVEIKFGDWLRSKGHLDARPAGMSVRPCIRERPAEETQGGIP
jgi:hypothetical protein